MAFNTARKVSRIKRCSPGHLLSPLLLNVCLYVNELSTCKYLTKFAIRENIIGTVLNYMLYTGCVKKKKAILNIHIKSEGINIFFAKILLDKVYHICGQMSKVHIYNPFIHYITLIQTLKRNYAVNGHEMYCTCVFLTCALLTY